MSSTTATAELAKYGVAVACEANPKRRYTLRAAQVIFDGRVGIEVWVYRRDGSPAAGDVFVVNQFPDGHGDVPVKPDGAGHVGFSAYGSTAYEPGTDRPRGPFTVSLVTDAHKDENGIVQVTGDLVSVCVQGMGNYKAEHTLWQLQFQEDAPEPEPQPLPVVHNDEELRALAAGRLYTEPVRYNPGAALWLVARDHELGMPASNEFEFADAFPRTWVYQAFANGITACVKGDWGNVRVVKW